MSTQTPDTEARRPGRPVLVAVAWPYANGQPHLGHIAGAYLPADIFARYQRMIGNRVLMVSGSDAHGTPITVRADEEGVTPQAIVDRYHPEFLRIWSDLAISFDLFTTTRTHNHEVVAQSVFTRLREAGYIYPKETSQFFDPDAGRFLPDRYVVGTCPHCSYPQARGDQCENCGRTLDPELLVDPRSKVTGAVPEMRQTTHFFLRLSGLSDQLLDWLQARQGWRRHVLNWSVQFVKDGLHDRAITRDLDWGVPLPTDELGPGKRLYVWFEAVIGYLSASKEWAAGTGDPEAWRAWWEDPEAAAYYFVGKDNIPFHTVIWPAMLLGHGGLDLPTDVPANQYVTFGGAKASKSAGIGRGVREYLDLLQPDALRFALASVLPEQNDTEISDADIVRRVNDELIANWGNLVNRVMAQINKFFGGALPETGDLDGVHAELLASVDAGLVRVGELLERVELRAALRAAMEISAEVNAYLYREEPWKTVKVDKATAAHSLAVAVQAISGITTALAPFLPFSSARVAEVLGIDLGVWARQPVAAGRELVWSGGLFTKLDADALDVAAPTGA
ncbi:methionine--tRNA ligase [Frankia sp. CcI49]|uniref:methionine--tRNA ligase n=1 Tax=unclassified Frankia TaxID=2632575 RepID=UPI0006CA4565|nr:MULTISPECIES: methionine--tRNA ligase [unclassified Frankia]KPM51400.1 methionine--tRNA ligase [Frankia sp. R43]ONH59373.1 methionine--tRNA ligase [Frankia sp. CcI49]